MRLRLLGICLLGLLALAFPTQSQAKEKVVFWFGASQSERAAYEKMVSDFNRTHPEIEVQPMLIPQSYVERKLLLSVAGGVPPDVVRFYTHLAGEMMSRGALEPLNDLVTRDKMDMSDFYPVSIEQNTYGGKLYGMPWVLSPQALYYNKKLFKEAGLDPNKPPKTWKELEKYALKLTKRDKDGTIQQVGFATFLNNPPNFNLYLWQSGGSPLSSDMKKVAFDSHAGIEALTWMRDFMIKEVGPTKPGMSASAAANMAYMNLLTFNSAFKGATQDTFGLGKVAMRIENPFLIPDLRKYFPDLDFGLAPVPYNTVNTSEVVGNSLVIPRGSKHRAAAWEFIKYATSKEQSIAVCKVGGRVPARKSAAASPEMQNDPYIKPFISQVDNARTTPVAPGYREASDALARQLEQALKGAETPAEALKLAASQSQSILNTANEDLSKYSVISWGKVAVVSGLVLVLAIVLGWWYVLKKTSDSRSARREAVQFYAFLTPWLVGFVVLTFGSTLASFLLSMCRWDILSPARFVGFGNFATLTVHDPRFLHAVGNTLYYAAFSIPLAMVGGLAISVLMNQKLRGIQVFRTIYYLPVVVSGVATALLWQWIFNPSTGLINQVLTFHQISIKWLGINLSWHPLITNPPKWLMDPNWSKPAFIIMALWGIGGAMIIYLAGLQGIPEVMYEAAKIDGANSWQKFRHVTLPLLSPTIFYQLIIGTMAALQFFTPAYIMTGGTGGPEDSTMFYSLYLFNNAFTWMKMGYASAMAWILFAVVLGITMLQFKFANKWVYYEGESKE